jgi:hypothetical protein
VTGKVREPDPEKGCLPCLKPTRCLKPSKPVQYADKRSTQGTCLTASRKAALLRLRLPDRSCQRLASLHIFRTPPRSRFRLRFPRNLRLIGSRPGETRGLCQVQPENNQRFKPRLAAYLTNGRVGDRAVASTRLLSRRFLLQSRLPVTAENPSTNLA